MDSLDFGNLPNIYGNQGALIIPQPFSENPGEYDDIELLRDSGLSINNDTKSRIFIGPNSDDDDRYKFFMVCAENKINALIERVREFNDNFERPEEFENEAVTMAIQQHGLRKNDQNISFTHGNLRGLNSSNDKPLLTTNADVPTTSSTNLSIGDKDDDDDDERRSKRKRHYECSSHQNSDKLKESFDFDDIYFLNEAVATAIEQKGLCSSSLDILN